jgi:hypothetical protein
MSRSPSKPFPGPRVSQTLRWLSPRGRRVRQRGEPSCVLVVWISS